MKLANLITLTIVGLLLTTPIFGQDKDKSQNKKDEKKQQFEVADGWLVFQAPSTWKKQTPKINFIHADFAIPKAEGDPKDGRITFSQVGGSVDANLTRWIGQFKDVDPDDEEQVKRETMKVDDQVVKLITIKGTYLDSAGGPFGPKTDREKYVLMGAAIEADNGQNVYIKAYGPEKTIKANKKALQEMLKTMKATDG